jgi:hypothetical protein
MGGGGIQLGRRRPWRSSSANHSLSFTAVLRPGAALLCWALTRIRVRDSSSTVKTGRHSTPVLSMATGVTSCRLSQSSSANRSAVMVPKVRTTRWGAPSGSVSSTQATTVFWWMSQPQQRGYRTCIPRGPI